MNKNIVDEFDFIETSINQTSFNEPSDMGWRKGYIFAMNEIRELFNAEMSNSENGKRIKSILDKAYDLENTI